jgi:hypothetical protein
MTEHSDTQDKLRRFFRVKGKVHIRANGVVDVEGNVHLTSELSKMPVQFGQVTGVFICAINKLITLEGCPTHVGDNFDCASNLLTTLAGCPTHVQKNFRCSDNLITSLTHAPTHVPGSFNCSKNKLTNLLGAPEHVGDDMSCHNNPLESLEGAPTHVGRNWWISYQEKLPLLRTINCQEVQFMNLNPKSNQVAEILNKHTGEGKPGAIKAAAELIRAGFKGNARW